MVLSEGVKERLGVVVDIVQTTFHWGFVPMVLYLGKYARCTCGKWKQSYLLILY